MTRLRLLWTTAAACAFLVACGKGPEPEASMAPDLNDLARQYVILELAMGVHDANHVDAYFGPEDLRDAARDAAWSVADIDNRAATLASTLEGAMPHIAGQLQQRRALGIVRRLQALRTRIALQRGETMSFDDESRRLFGVAAPDYDAAHFDAILHKIDALLPGPGSVSSRVNEFREQFVIPPARLAAVFEAAIAECRRRTLAHITLPPQESFRLEYVTNKPWSGYNWYQGNAASLIQVNTDLPIYISRAVDLGCHEGYPGHHTFNALLEENLVNGKGWVEFSLYPLFSPQSLIAEGSGNYGIRLAFPGAQRVQFEKEVLFPIAGLDPESADRYYELLQLLDELDYAGNEAARDYLNGTIDRAQAVQWLIDYSLSSRERASQRVDFIDTYRSYVINYNLGQDMVRAYVERGTSTDRERWARFERILSEPTLPEDLLPAAE